MNQIRFRTAQSGHALGSEMPYVEFVRGGRHDTVENDWEKSLDNGRNFAWQRAQPPWLSLHVIFKGKKYAEKFISWVEGNPVGLEESITEESITVLRAYFRDSMEEDEKEMLELLNDLRKKAGLAPIDNLDEECQFYIPKKTEPGKNDAGFALAASVAESMMEYTEDALSSVVLGDRKIRVSGLFCARVGFPVTAEAYAAVRSTFRRLGCEYAEHEPCLEIHDECSLFPADGSRPSFVPDEVIAKAE